MKLKPSLSFLPTQSKAFALALFSCFFSSQMSAAPALVDFGFDSIYQNNISETPESMGSNLNGASTRIFASARKGFILSEDLSFMAKVGAGYKAQHINQSADYIGLDLSLIHI